MLLCFWAQLMSHMSVLQPLSVLLPLTCTCCALCLCVYTLDPSHAPVVLCTCTCACVLCAQHLGAGGKLDLTLLQGLIGHAWAHEQHKERYGALADKEDAAYQVGGPFQTHTGVSTVQCSTS
jgi:hypothetical protein